MCLRCLLETIVRAQLFRTFVMDISSPSAIECLSCVGLGWEAEWEGGLRHTQLLITASILQKVDCILIQIDLPVFSVESCFNRCISATK